MNRKIIFFGTIAIALLMVLTVNAGAISQTQMVNEDESSQLNSMGSLSWPMAYVSGHFFYLGYEPEFFTPFPLVHLFVKIDANAGGRLGGFLINGGAIFDDLEYPSNCVLTMGLLIGSIRYQPDTGNSLQCYWSGIGIDIKLSY